MLKLKLTEDKCKSEAIRRSKDDAFWAVCMKDNNKLIGNIYLSKQDFDTWELGYAFNSSYQGNGYATESARAVVNYAIKQFNSWRIIAMCNPDNEKSWGLLERLNMRREGYLIQNIYFKTDDNIVRFGRIHMSMEFCHQSGLHSQNEHNAYLS